MRMNTSSIELRLTIELLARPSERSSTRLSRPHSPTCQAIKSRATYAMAASRSTATRSPMACLRSSRPSKQKRAKVSRDGSVSPRVPQISCLTPSKPHSSSRRACLARSLTASRDLERPPVSASMIRSTSTTKSRVRAQRSGPSSRLIFRTSWM